MAEYAVGCITRIKMKNFMTYSNMEIYPKKGINLIIGKNGSGKSSIMCAVCLGLGGKPQFTGRSSKLSDFIKHGCKEAVVEIELESKKKNVVICRKITKNQCQWYLNKSQTNQNKVESVVKKFNIDTSNVCQFFFQGSAFSKMDKKQKLENMLQVIGEPQLFKLFNELKELHMNVSEVQKKIEKCQRHKDSDESKNRRIFEEVRTQEKRTRLKKELMKLHKKKHMCMKIEEYYSVRVEHRSLKEKVKTLLQYLDKLHSEKEKAVSEDNIILNSYQQCSTKLKEYESQKNVLMKKLKCNSDSLTKLFEKVKNEKIEHKNKMIEKQDQAKRLHDISKQIEALEFQLSEEANKCKDYEKTVQLDSPALAQLQSEIIEVNQRIERASVEKNRLAYAANEIEKQLTSMQDEQNKKFKILERCDKPTYKAACWLKENKHIFKHNVYFPIMLEINIKSNEYSKYVESIIPFRDMIAFLCEDKSDCEHLKDILKNQMKLAVNLVMAHDTPMSYYKSPPLAFEYRQCGLECFVKDLFTAPEPVMKYLCAIFGIHRIPVTKLVIDSENHEFILQKFPIFCFENSKISCKRSRYGDKNLSIKIDTIQNRNLLLDHNDKLQKEVEENLKQMKKNLEAKARELSEYNTILAEMQKRQSILFQNKKLLLEQQSKIKALKSELLQKMSYKALISVVIDEECEKSKMTKIMQSSNGNISRTMSESNSLFMDFIQLEKEIIKLILNMNFLSRNFKISNGSHQDLDEEIKIAKIEYQNLKKDVVEKKEYGLVLSAEIHAFKMPFLEVMAVDAIEQKINQIEVSLNYDDDNEHVVVEYQSRKQKIDEFQQEIDGFENNLHELKKLMGEKKTQFLQPLQHHIKNINKKFSYYFKHYFSSAGEINLDVPEDTDDFTNYGLQMQLKFRDTDELSELTCGQSGGESSIASAIFILSLQGLRKIPFRWIDEFNQHLDPENEKKIYEILFDSRKDRHSQYFLLTQELLLDFKYPDDVAFHIIFNSCFMDFEIDVQTDLTRPHYFT